MGEGLIITKDLAGMGTKLAKQDKHSTTLEKVKKVVESKISPL